MVIVKGHLVPFYDEREGSVKAETMDEAYVSDLAKSFLEGLKELIDYFFHKVLGMKGKIKKDPSDDKQLKFLHVLGDLITLYYRIPLIKEITPPTRGQTTLSVTDFVLKYFEAFRRYLVGEDIGGDILYSKIKGVADVDELEKGVLADKIRKTFGLGVELKDVLQGKAEVVEEFMFKIPADTRPGYSTSSLLIHKLVTSAFAWGLRECELIGRGKISPSEYYNMEILRLAALLHDIGKPFNWKAHVEESVKRVRYLLSDVAEEDVINDVVSIIQDHHSPHPALPITQLLRKADRITSNIDRLSKIIEKAIEEINFEEIGVEDPATFKNNLKRWLGLTVGVTPSLEMGEELIERFGEEPLVKVNSILVDKIKEFSLKETQIESTPITCLKIVKIDSRGIQDYIYSSSKLEELVAGSILVNYVQMVEIPLKMFLRGIPLETILYGAGGNIYIVLPQSRISILEDIVNDTYDVGIYNGLGALVVYEDLTTDIVQSIKNLERKASLLKITEARSYDIDYGLGYKCESCKTRQAVVTDNKDGSRLCLTCYGKRKIGEIYHFRARWEYDLQGSNWGNLGPRILEYLSGHSLQEVEEMVQEKYGGEYKKFSVIKMDGNAIGRYMANTISLTHMIYKSFRLDLATKRALRKFYDILMSKDLRDVSLDDLKRIYLGTIYVGGDDLLMVAPSYLSIPLASIVMEEFVKGMGLEINMSAGIVAAKPKTNIWELFESAEALLSKTKELSRRLKPDFSNGRVINAGGITFLDWKTTTISEGHVSTLLEIEGGRGTRIGTFILNPSDQNLAGLEALLVNILGVDPKDKLQLVSKIIKIAEGGEVNEVRKNLKDLRTVSKEVLSVLAGDTNIKTAILFTLRNIYRSSRQRDRRKEDYYIALAKMIQRRDTDGSVEYQMPLNDIIDFIDLLLGGVLS